MLLDFSPMLALMSEARNQTKNQLHKRRFSSLPALERSRSCESIPGLKGALKGVQGHPRDPQTNNAVRKYEVGIVELIK